MSKEKLKPCPFGSRFEDELELMRKYEPKLYVAAINIFGKSYEYTRKYRDYKEQKKQEERQKRQEATP